MVSIGLNVEVAFHRLYRANQRRIPPQFTVRPGHRVLIWTDYSQEQINAFVPLLNYRSYNSASTD
jgi:hypothetical protein